MDVDVLIVGAGPTGLMLANQIARRGVRVMIVDRHSGPAQQTRAMAVQARTLEIYAWMGLAERALELGAVGRGANLWSGGQRRARIPLGDIGRHLSPYPFVLLLGQDENERILGERLHEQGVDVRWNTELVALAQTPGRVDATLQTPDGGTVGVTAAYVAGCDGAHSAVRHLSGIEFSGAPYEHVFYVADTTCTGPMVPGELNVYLWRGGFHLFFPMRGADRWRAIGILPEALRGRDDVAFEEVAPAVAAQAGAAVRFTGCSWFSTYRIHHRCATRFRDRRCFLLGDAAHIHSPAGGQGMNTGLQDAYNLAWKLAMVIGGEAKDALLDTYERERIPVAQRLVETTDRAFALLVADGPLAGLFRTTLVARVAALAMKVGRIRTLAFRTLSQTGIRYRTSPLSKTLAGVPDGAPHAGDRFPWLQVSLRPDGPVEDLYRHLDDTRFNLVLIGQDVPDEWTEVAGDRLRTHVIAADDPRNRDALRGAGIPAPAFYLLRPDGHVGLTGGTFDAAVLTDYLAALA